MNKYGDAGFYVPFLYHKPRRDFHRYFEGEIDGEIRLETFMSKKWWINGEIT